ncbi:MAG: ribokinase [Gemmatales bacterium]|nr:MAG: ribokinase [Gemmatales bacterium]
MKRYDVLGLGCVAVDDLLYVEAYPPADTKVPIRHSDRQCGGLTATALVAAARMGARCAYAGVLGSDVDSRFVLDCFRREGIDTGPVMEKAAAQPIHSIIIVDESAKTRTIFYDLRGSTGAAPNHPPQEVIESTKVLFIDHYGIEGMLRASRIARASGIHVVADFERNDWPAFDELLRWVDHLIVSRAFAAKLTGCLNPADAARHLWCDGREVVVITGGDEGCWYYSLETQHPVHQPAFPVSVQDTTGCGDVFHGVYAAMLAKNMDLHLRIRYASAAAALKAMKAGGQAGIPGHFEVENFLAEHEKD